MKTIPLFLTLFLAATGFAQRVEFDSVAAEVNDRPILWSEVRAAVAPQIRMLHENRARLTPLEYARRLDELLNQGRDALIDRELMLDHFDQSGFRIRDRVVESRVHARIQSHFDGDETAFHGFLSSAGMSVGEYRDFVRDAMIIESLQAQNAAPPVFLTPMEIEETYLANRDLFVEEGRVAFRSITILKSTAESDEAAQRAKIDEIRQQLLNGTDFDLLARLHSVDTGAGEARNFQKSELAEEVRGPAFKLPIDEISPVIEGETFFAILRVESRVDDRLVDLIEVRDQVEMLTMQRKRAEAVREWLGRLRRDADIVLKSPS